MKSCLMISMKLMKLIVILFLFFVLIVLVNVSRVWKTRAPLGKLEWNAMHGIELEVLQIKPQLYCACEDDKDILN